MILAAALTSAGSITAALITRGSQPDGMDSSLVMHIRNDRIQDKEFLQSAINNAIRQLSEILKLQTREIIIAFQTENVREAVRNVQAHVKVLENLLVHNEIDDSLRTELVQSILVPLEVGIHKVQFGDLEGSAEAIRDACIITGLSTLLAGYGFLGQDRPILRQQLEKTARNAQYTLLDAIARHSVEGGSEIPWKRLPFSLPIEAAEDLAEVYHDIVGSIPLCPFDVDALTVPEIRSHLRDVHDLGTLEAIREHERSNRQRTGVLDAIEARVRRVKKT